jgi:hypothetical protein
MSRVLIEGLHGIETFCSTDETTATAGGRTDDLAEQHSSLRPGIQSEHYGLELTG